MKKQFSNILTAAALSALAWSCNQADPEPKGDYARGVFVINEGNFSQNNGGLSFFTREQTTAEDEIFTKVNGGKTGGGIQGYVVAGNNGLLLVDNSNPGLDKVEIVDANSLQRIATIGAPDIENPRKVVTAGNNKAYVSCFGTNADYAYGTGYIAVIDLTTNKVTKKINIPNGPDRLVYHNSKLYIGTTSFSTGNQLTILSTSNDEIAATITTGTPAAPIGIDANGKLWVGTTTKAMRIDPSSNAVEASLPIGSNPAKEAGNFALSSDLRNIIFNYTSDYGAKGETYKFAITDSQINVTTPLIKRVFTGLAVDPSQGLIYGGVTPSYIQSGYAVRYRMDGSVVDSVKVGVAPTGFVFR